MEARGGYTIHADAIAQMNIAQNFLAVGDGQRGAPAPAGGGVEGLQRGDRCVIVNGLARFKTMLESLIYSLPMVSTRPVNMLILDLVEIEA